MAWRGTEQHAENGRTRRSTEHGDRVATLTLETVVHGREPV